MGTTKTCSNEHCEKFGDDLDFDWEFCPFCGQPLEVVDDEELEQMQEG